LIVSDCWEGYVFGGSEEVVQIEYMFVAGTLFEGFCETPPYLKIFGFECLGDCYFDIWEIVSVVSVGVTWGSKTYFFVGCDMDNSGLLVSAAYN